MHGDLIWPTYSAYLIKDFNVIGTYHHLGMIQNATERLTFLYVNVIKIYLFVLPSPLWGPAMTQSAELPRRPWSKSTAGLSSTCCSVGVCGMR